MSDIRILEKYLRKRVDNLLIRGAYYGAPAYTILFTINDIKYRYYVYLTTLSDKGGKKVAKQILKEVLNEKHNSTVEMGVYFRGCDK